MVLWNPTTGEAVQRFEGHLEEITCADISPDGRRIVGGANDSTVRMLDIESGEELFQVEKELFVFAVSFSADGKWFACPDYGFSVDVRDSFNGEHRVRDFSVPYNNVPGLHLGLGARPLPGQVALCDAKTGAELVRLKSHTGCQLCRVQLRQQAPRYWQR